MLRSTTRLQRASADILPATKNASFRRRLSSPLPPLRHPRRAFSVVSAPYQQHQREESTHASSSSVQSPRDAASSDNSGVAATTSALDNSNETGVSFHAKEQNVSSQGTDKEDTNLNRVDQEQVRQQKFDNEIRQQSAVILEEIPYGEFTPEVWKKAFWVLDKWIRTSRMAQTPESVDQSFLLLDRLVMEQEVQNFHPLSCQHLKTKLLREMVFNWNRCIRNFHSFSLEDQALLRFEYTPMELLARMESYGERSPMMQLDTKTLNQLMDGASWCCEPSSSGTPHMISPRVATSFVESLFDRMDAPNKWSKPQQRRRHQDQDQDQDHHHHLAATTAASAGGANNKSPNKDVSNVAFHSANYHPGMAFFQDNTDTAPSNNSHSHAHQYHPKYVAIRRNNSLPRTTPNKITYTNVILLFARNGLAGRAEAQLNRLYKTYMEHKSPLLKPDIRVFTAVLQALRNCEEGLPAAERAESILGRMHELAACGLIPEVAPDEIAYCVVLAAYAKRADRTKDAHNKRSSSNKIRDAEKCLAKARELFTRMQQLGFASTSAYNIMINALGKSGRPDEAQALLKQMHEEYAGGNQKVQPGSIAYNTVIAAWARSGDSTCGDRAMKLLEDLEQQYQAGTVKDPPDAFTYNSVLACLAQAGKAEQADALLRHMKQTQRANGVDISPDTMTYNTVMDAYGTVKNPQRAEEILEDMYKEFTEMQSRKHAYIRVRPDVQSFTTVLTAWHNSGHPQAAERAEAILKTMHNVNDAGVLPVAPTNPAYNVVLATWSRTQQKQAPFRALDILDTMEELFSKGSATVRPDALAYNNVIRSFANNNLAYQAEQILERQHVQSTPAAQGGGGNPLAKPDKQIYQRVLGSYSRLNNHDAAERAEALYNRWQSRFESGSAVSPPDDVSAKIVCTAWANATRHDQRAKGRLQRFLNQVRGTQLPATTGRSCLNGEDGASAHDAVLEAFVSLKDARSAHDFFLNMCNDFQEGEESSKPDQANLNRVLTLWRISKNQEAPKMILELVDKINELSAANQIDWTPSIQSYRIYFNCLEDMRSMDAAMKAQLLFLNLERASDDADNSSAVRLEARDYIQLVRIWTKVADNVEDSMVLADAAFERLTHRFTPSAATYDLLIKGWQRSSHPTAAARLADLQAEKAIIHKD
ncbi:Pentatricopeptide repeat-containing protein [Seminavis robusta]|uniref:Pentatricopeptide repeat-containing protein n=1 Tax=Seminavis robusta TaxID=568900 RepID=A0A9N8DEB1_9STRA|nr:Pentatricopeptide repeat-containing protein [Seminavis robusta]|eukprot:Sro54_g031850.1 Pentatricopeptide repeat-containing protein (1157) ;mRNA; f:61926-65396